MTSCGIRGIDWRFAEVINVNVAVPVIAIGGMSSARSASSWVGSSRRYLQDAPKMWWAVAQRSFCLKYRYHAVIKRRWQTMSGRTCCR